MLIDERGRVIELLSGEGYGCETNVVCPNCRSDYTHIKSVGTLVGTDEHEASIYEGTGQTGTTGSRRSAVEIVFECEQCPKLFALVIQQHKGINLLQFSDERGRRKDY